jgi:glyoxylase I family protein
MTYPTFIDHLVFRVQDIERTATFYTSLLGKPEFRDEHIAIFVVGDTQLFFTVASPTAAFFNKENVGLNHIALGVRTHGELEQIAAQLTYSEIPHSGIRVDAHGQKDYIWLDDPDGLRVEFYLREL